MSDQSSGGSGNENRAKPEWTKIHTEFESQAPGSIVAEVTRLDNVGRPRYSISIGSRRKDLGVKWAIPLNVVGNDHVEFDQDARLLTERIRATIDAAMRVALEDAERLQVEYLQKRAQQSRGRGSRESGQRPRYTGPRQPGDRGPRNGATSKRERPN